MSLVLTAAPVTIRQRARNFALAGLFAATILSGAATQAHAEGKNEHPVDDGTRCDIQTGPGQYDFYLPGDTFTYVVPGDHTEIHTLQCNDEGGWVEVDRTVRPPRGYRGPITTPTTTTSPLRR